LDQQEHSDCGTKAVKENDLSFLRPAMQDFMNTVVLICAALASLGMGVMLAYVVCRAGFALLRLRTPPAEPAAVPAKTQTIEA
jgi:hypothetical protein